MIKPIFILIILLTFFSCKEAKPTDEILENDIIKVSKAQFQSSKMEINIPSQEDFDVAVFASGKIDVPAQHRAKVSPFIGGYIKSMNLIIGQKISKGQALMTLENTEYIDIQKEYVSFSNQLKYLKSEYVRQKTLYDEQITSQKNYLKAESDFKQANAICESLKQKLRLLNINISGVERGNFSSQVTLISPISGDLTVLNANIGQFVSTSDNLLEVVNTQHLQLNLKLFEKDIVQIKQGQKIKFNIPESNKNFFESEVIMVGKSIENEDRSIAVFGNLSTEIQQKLLAGMFVEAQIITSTQKGMAIPIDALIKEENTYFVLKLMQEKNEYQFKKIPVKIGAKNEKFVEIISNNLINSSTRILTKGAFEMN
jgi:cobalt-zinc-cadmium efflux system membrane fusion protein